MKTMPPEHRTAEQDDLLHRAQANDAYWHGLFGGIYLPHLRRAVWNAMVALEASLAALDPRPTFTCDDLDLDGNDEVVLANAAIIAFVRDDGEAALTEFDAIGLAHNFADTLQRRREHYYRNVAASPHEHAPTEGIASAHDRVTFKHDIVAADLRADTRPRGLFVDTWITPDDIEQLPNYQRHGSEQASFVGTVSGGAVTKRYRLRPEDVGRLRVRNAAGQMVPLETMITVTDVAGPAIVNHYNSKPSAEIRARSFRSATGAPSLCVRPERSKVVTVAPASASCASHFAAGVG